ncbi:sarcosine oxidase subunit gamma [Aliihoeflea sp. 40Bstr573]|uniref:sarcosine oxidase subunit gamma n=1 Tax=Aliihoeflea sp. 40Bstr573 TaxID=2696467 RepID=UPI0020950838|nr:sarcosine oxidase subunit gamma family protein [Aliihoeflea sp. 40Bstr573]MCO6385492.1 sarcosine oxidase subunit gamma [Aliihoeflea sp. 40Bstr573]
MVEIVSPLEPDYRRGAHGNREGGSGVTLSETQPGSIVQLAAWPGQDEALRKVIQTVTGLHLDAVPGAGAIVENTAAFGFAPGRWLVVDQAEGRGETLRDRIGSDLGTVCDLSHGRTAIAVEGERAERLLSKLYALDFSAGAFPVGQAKSTAHHDVFTLIHRTGVDRFDLYVYRSFARSFWHLLRASAEEFGYTVE